MDLNEICHAFGGSIFLDDYTLDIRSAKQKLEDFETRPDKSSEDNESLTSLLLLDGLLNAAKGNLKLSALLLKHASTYAQKSGSARLVFRCDTYDFFLFSIKADPPLWHFHEDRESHWRKLSDQETRQEDWRRRFIETRSGIWPCLTAIDRLERDIINDYAHYADELQMAAFAHHPAYRQRKNMAVLFTSSVPFSLPLIEGANRLGLRGVSRHLRRLNAQYLLAGGSTQGVQELEQLYQECLGDGDLTGAASCQLMLGDNRLSLPFTSPIVLNICLMNRTSAQLTDLYDELESQHHLREDPDAERFYQVAAELFASAASKRGRAAVELRRGCVALAGYLHVRYLSGGPDEADEGISIPDTGSGSLENRRRSAGLHFVNALRDLGESDGVMSRLVSAHTIILRILTSCPPGQLQRPAEDTCQAVRGAADVGAWAKENDNKGVAQVIGLLFLGVGRLLSAAHQNLDAASLCCACARSCFRGAEEDVLELHATVQHAQLHYSHGNTDTARSYLDDAQRVLENVIERRIDPLIRTIPSTERERRSYLEVIRTNMITNLDGPATSMYGKSPRAESWAFLKRKLLPKTAGSTVKASLASIMSLFMSSRENDATTSNTAPKSTVTQAVQSQDNAPNEPGNEGDEFGTIMEDFAKLGATMSAIQDLLADSSSTGAPGTEHATRAVPDSQQVPSTSQIAIASNEPADRTSDLIGHLFGGLATISDIRQQFDAAMGARKTALVVENDWEKGQGQLLGVLQSATQLEVAGRKSIELYNIRAAVLHYLGRHGEIKAWLPDAVPVMLGGRLPTGGGGPSQEAAPTTPDPTMEALERQIFQKHCERSLSLCFVARDWDLGVEVLRNLQERAPKVLENLQADRGEWGWINMVYVAAIEEHSGNLDTAFRWLINALDILETRRAKLTDVADRRELLSVIHSSELFAGLARLSLYFAESGNTKRFEDLADHWTFRGPSWMHEALLFLEQGRARVLLDLFTPEHMSEEFLEWSHKLRSEELDMQFSKGAGTESAKAVEDLATYLEKLHSDLREEAESPSRAMILARLHRPHFAATAARLYEAVPEDALVVHINPSRDGTLILYISRKGIELTRTSCLTDQDIDQHVLRYLKCFKTTGTTVSMELGFVVESHIELRSLGLNPGAERGGRLRVLDLVRLRSRAALVVFQACVRLYGAGAKEVREVLEGFREACMALGPEDINLGHRMKIVNTLNAVIADAAAGRQPDYTHPFFWAPFIMVGIGAQTLNSNCVSTHNEVSDSIMSMHDKASEIIKQIK
ncbi:hypothetical protein N0V88_004171 [Collariella sp. IMI 366227]|nr:hypothetical protein N0V88_004171 [Collariella sp. IMI 366227]